MGSEDDVYYGMSIYRWQEMLNKWALSKGFDWKRAEIDTMLLRLHSEISEASEAIRDGKILNFAEELADIFIRLVNVAEVMGIDLEGAVMEKHKVNLKRPHLHGRKKK